MCIICNGGTHDDVMFDLDAKLDRFGFTVTAVQGTKRKPGWAYTIGLVDRFDHPELVVVGWHLDAWANAVHHFAERVRDGERFVDVDTVESPIGPYEIVDVHPRQLAGSLLANWFNYYGAIGRTDLVASARQIIIPEPRCEVHADLEFRLDEPAPLLARPPKPPATRRTNAPRGRKRR